MTDDNRQLRVEILIQQKKFAEAEKILKGLLSEDSGNIQYLSLLSEVYCSRTSLMRQKASLIMQSGYRPIRLFCSTSDQE